MKKNKTNKSFPKRGALAPRLCTVRTGKKTLIYSICYFQTDSKNVNSKRQDITTIPGMALAAELGKN